MQQSPLGGFETRPLRVTGKSVAFAGLVGTRISLGLALVCLLCLEPLIHSHLWAFERPACEMLVSPDIGLAGGTKLVGAASGELSATGLVLAHIGSLLLRRCLLFLMKTRPSSVLTSYDLTSTCCSTRALYQFRFGDPMTSDYFRVIVHRYPVGVSFTGNSRRFHRPIHLMNRSVKTP